jgi:hypothetical protein
MYTLNLSRLIIVAALAACLAGCSDGNETKIESADSETQAQKEQLDTYLFEPVRAAAACISVLEKPDAKRVLLIGDDAMKVRGVFEAAGMKCQTDLSGKVDIAFVDCSSMSAQSRDKVFSCISANGVFAWLMDVRGVSAEAFRERIGSFGRDEAHLWMPGENRWLITGRKVPRMIKLSAMLEFFSADGMFDVLSRYRLGGVAELFSSYVGTVSEIMPAFAAGDLSAEVKPEFFLSREVPPLRWVSAEDVDKDVSNRFFADIRSMQMMRRLAVKGNMAAMQGGENTSVDHWSRALLRNPGELFVRERIDRLERNARGFLAVKKFLQAMKCYETIIKIDPKDIGALHNFAQCLRNVGRVDIADKILKRVEELKRR